MAIHNFVCDNCGNAVQDTNTKGVHVCSKCGADMRWDLHNIGIADGDYYHVSDSLAVHPDLAEEHRTLFPDVELTSEGQPIFTSVKQQQKYCERCGFEKKEQRNRKRGVRIA